MEKYFIRNDYTGYFVSIIENGYEGTSTEIFGRISFDKGSVDNILDTVRGTSLNLKLEANPLLTFDEFSEADEKKYTVKVTKNNQTVFNGFLKPDGVTQSYVRDIWVVDLDFVDGLGSLKDLAFVKPNGLNFTGKMSIYEVISGCLDRTGLLMTINSFVDVHYLDYAGTNILKDTYVSADRFFKIDAQTTGGGTTMTCDEVLKSVLNLFSACITQENGQWWVYRPNDFTANTANFIDNTLDTTFPKLLYKKVGSQIDNYFPHHCNGNQQIQTKGAISAYRINYKYGFRQGELLNPKLNHDSNLIFDNWTKSTYLGSVVLINDPLDTSGLIMQTQYILFSGTTIPILTSENISLLAGSQIDMVVEMESFSLGETSFAFRVIRSDGYYMDNDGTWKNSTRVVYTRNNGTGTFTWTLKCEPVPANCTVKIEIRNVLSSLDDNAEVEIKSVQVNNNFNYDGRIGEFHTVSRVVAPSSIIKENQEVYNGDSIGDIFEGAIYKSDKTTLTSLWTRKNKLEEKRILQISAEDDMRIQQLPTKTFTGDFYGELPYLSIIEINNINGKFMFTEYSYDTDSNITKGKLQQFYTNEVANLDYALTFDYGKVVSPVIKG